jgi:dethiobiotin synthetase
LDPELVCPYRFSLPASPEIAARAAGVAAIDFDRILDAYRALSEGSDLMLVEGAGGLLTPLGRGRTIADLIARLGLPVLLVARAGLGTINHALLTIEALRRRRLTLLGIILSCQRRRADPSSPTNQEAIVRYGDVRTFGTLPWLSRTVRGQPAVLGLAATRSLRLDNLWNLLGQAVAVRRMGRPSSF